ncbi:hypothetical protein PG994_002926 [Apiospora phragmitis]|uniref:ZNFX1 domain-containing protein n=1 Tax=Apiospora phragmitis TaxID=2905665 RepID=A0ABR1W6M0_9PEZI
MTNQWMAQQQQPNCGFQPGGGGFTGLPGYVTEAKKKQVFIKGYQMTDQGPLCRITFSTERAGKKIRWTNTRRLTPGTVVALSACLTSRRQKDFLASTDWKPHVDRFGFKDEKAAKDAMDRACRKFLNIDKIVTVGSGPSTPTKAVADASIAAVASWGPAPKSPVTARGRKRKTPVVNFSDDDGADVPSVKMATPSKRARVEPAAKNEEYKEDFDIKGEIYL